MLVIGRKPGEFVDIVVPHDDGSETVLRVGLGSIDRKDRATLLIDAPREVRVTRTEIPDTGAV